MEASASGNTLVENNKLTEELQWIEMEDRELYPGRFEQLKRIFFRNPLLPIGCIGTVTALSLGLRSLLKGEKNKSQLMMRWRVGLQASTIGVFALGLYVESILRKKQKD